MAKKIGSADLFEANLFLKEKENAEALLITLQKLEEEYKDILKVNNEIIKQSDTKSVEGLKKREQAVKAVTTAEKEMQKIEKALVTAEEKLNLSRSDANKKLQETRVKTNAVNKELRDNAKRTLESGNAYKKLSARVNDASAKFKRLAAEFGVTSKQARKAKKELDLVQKELREIDVAAKDGRRNVGNYGSALGGIGKGLKAVALRFVSVIGLIYGLGRAIISSINIFKNFQQENANLASVLGKNRDEITALTEDAKRLGASTAFTASEVTKLQTAFSKLGFNEDQILNATEATLALAAATRVDLDEAATVAAQTLNGFGLAADQTQRVVDVMAKSFSSSALDMSKFSTAMAIVAPVAKTAGQDIEEVTAMLGVLVDAGIDASTAGTGLRNIFLDIAKNGMTLEDAMSQIQKATNKNAIAMDLFGKRGATVATVLAENVEKAEMLGTVLDSAGGSAQAMADEQLNTLQGSITKMSSAWEGFILSLEDGEGAFGGLLTSIIDGITSAIQWLTKLNTTFKDETNVVFNIIGRIYKQAYSFVSALIRTFGVLVDLISGDFTKAWEKVKDITYDFANALLLGLLEDYNNYMKGASAVTKAFTETQKNNILIMKQADKITQQLIESIGREAAEIDNKINALNDSNLSEEERNQLMADLIEQYPQLEDQMLDEQGNLKELTELRRLFNQEIINEALARSQAAEQQRIMQELIDAEIAGIQARANQDPYDFMGDFDVLLSEAKFDSAKTQLENLNSVYTQVKENLQTELGEVDFGTPFNTLEDQSTEAETTIQSLTGEIIALEKAFRNISLNKDDYRFITDEDIELIKAGNKEAIQGQINLLKQQKQGAVGFLDNLTEQKRELLGLKDDNQDIVDLTNEQTESTKKTNEEKKKQQELLKKIKEEQQRLNDEETVFQFIRDKNQDAMENEIDDVIAHYDKMFELARDNAEQEKELQELLMQDINAIIDKYQKEELDLRTKQANEKKKLLEDEAKARNKEEAKRRDDRKKEQEQELEFLQERIEASVAFYQTLAELSTERIEKEQENIDKEIEASRSRQEQLAQIANQGQLDAQQSLAAEIRREAELERQKQQLERRKIRRQTISKGLELLSANLNAGQNGGDAVATSIRQLTGFIALLSNLPGFYKGTENAPEGYAWTDEKGAEIHLDKHGNIKDLGSQGGARIKYLEKGDKILTAQESKIVKSQMGVQPHIEAREIRIQQRALSGQKYIVDGLRNVVKAVDEKPVQSFEYDEINKAVIDQMTSRSSVERKHQSNKPKFM